MGLEWGSESRLGLGLGSELGFKVGVQGCGFRVGLGVGGCGRVMVGMGRREVASWWRILAVQAEVGGDEGLAHEAQKVTGQSPSMCKPINTGTTWATRRLSLHTPALLLEGSMHLSYDP